MSRLRTVNTILISGLTLAVAVGAAFLLPWAFPVAGPVPGPVATQILTVAALSLLVLIAQPWRVAFRFARGDVSISMAIDVATMLLLPLYLAAAGSAVGTALYHLISSRNKENRVSRAFVRGVITFAAVALGGWLYRYTRPGNGPIVFDQDWLAMAFGIFTRLAVRVVCYPLGMAALRSDSVVDQVRAEWNKLPLIPFVLTTTLGGSAALIWQTQPKAVVLLLGPLVATWSASQEFQRLNELLATLEDKVADRTARLADTVRALERRLAESEALHAVDRAMVQEMHPEQVLAVIARESVRVTGGSSALVTLLSEDGERQFIRACYGIGMEGYMGVELPIEGSLTGQVIKTGEAMVSENPPRDSRLNQNLVRSGRWRGVIEAPLRAKERVLGVLVVATDRDVMFDDQHLRLLTLLANQAGLVLENSRLHVKAREVAVLEERNRLARELHDSVTQVLFGLTLNLESAAGLMERKPEKSAQLVARSQEMAAEALADMRSLIFELRPAALQEKGLAMALSNHVNLFRRRQGIEANLSVEGEERISPDAEFCLYRIAQEALNNVTKHAKAKHVHVHYSTTGGWAVLRVTDDGVGFDPTAQRSGQSFGMIGMNERVAELEGTVTVTSAPGGGTTVEARIPLHQEVAPGEAHSRIDL